MINAVIDNEIEGRRWFSWGMINFDAAESAFENHDGQRALVYCKLASHFAVMFKSINKQAG
jgi:hypothetical protein